MVYGRTVLTTWKISFDKIEQDCNAEASACLFKLLAYCAPDNIPLQMFIDGRDKLPSPLAAALEPSDALGHIELTNRLTRYSLVTVRDDGKGNTLLSVHRLMQAVVKHDLGSNAEFLQCCLDMAESVFHYEYGTREDFDMFTLYLPHMLEIALCSELCLEDENEAIIKAGRVFHEAGRGLNKKGEYAEALEWYDKALAIREKVLGLEDPSTATTYSNIALVYYEQGEYAKALEWNEKSLAIKEKILDLEDPSMASTYDNIALIYNRQGEYAKAMEWQEKSLAIREKVLGLEHPSTAATYNNIGVVYEYQGEYAKALEWYNKSLAIKEKMLGAEHPDTIMTRNNIVDVNKAMG
jgi:tetratricopeptide (TPR) repeat protein